MGADEKKEGEFRFDQYTWDTHRRDLTRAFIEDAERREKEMGKRKKDGWDTFRSVAHVLLCVWIAARSSEALIMSDMGLMWIIFFHLVLVLMFLSTLVLALEFADRI